MAADIELRCDANPGRLFAKVRSEGKRPPIVDGNLIEFHCRDCVRDMHRDGDVTVVRVLHRFDIVGSLVETEVIREDNPTGR